MWKPLTFEAWFMELKDYLSLVAADQAVDPTEEKVFYLKKYQEYLASFD